MLATTIIILATKNQELPKRLEQGFPDFSKFGPWGQQLVKGRKGEGDFKILGDFKTYTRHS